MTATLTPSGWVVEKDPVDERFGLQSFTGAQIAAMNARIAAGSNEFPVGTKLIRSDDQVVLTLFGVGAAARFAVYPTDIAGALSAMQGQINGLSTDLDAAELGIVANTAAIQAVPSAIDTAVAAAMAAAIKKSTPPGLVAAHSGATAPAGWIKANGGTIGSAVSGATTRANADTLDLFTLYWADYTNAALPIQTSAGAASARGASAAADWAANKRITVPEVRGEALRFLDDGRGIDAGRANASLQGDQNKTHTHGVTQLPHSHNPSEGVFIGYVSSGGNGAYAAGSNLKTISVSSSTIGITIDSQGGTELRMRNVALLGIIKL